MNGSPPVTPSAVNPRSRPCRARSTICSWPNSRRLDETIAALSEEIEERLGPFERELGLLETIPGVGRRSAQVILAELGPDMSRFPSDRHAASWAAVCPGNDESAGKRRSGRMRKGNNWLRETLIECAHAATRTEAT